MTAAERAEAYLRLMAESELRRAVAYPRSEPPGPPGLPPPPSPRSASPGRLLAPLLPPVRTAARVSGPLLASLWPAARSAASAARPSPAGRAAEPVLWRVLRVRQTVQPFRPGRGRLAGPLAEAGLDRVRRVAGALVPAGVIGEAAARRRLESLVDALALRGKLERRPGVPATRLGRSWGAGSRWRPSGAPPPLPGGPVQAVSIGPDAAPRSRRGPGRGLPARPGPGPGPRRDHRRGVAGRARSPLRPPGRGPQCRCRSGHHRDRRAWPPVSGRRHRPVGHGRWSVTFDLTPVPPPATRWLDITGPASTDPVRVALSRAPGPRDRVPWDPAGSPGRPARPA